MTAKVWTSPTIEETKSIVAQLTIVGGGDGSVIILKPVG
ncbi:MAG: hypothetical protein QOC73_1534 [Actinomycetota bacterium]|jgi:hypothetical protein|nr:hypothetical protein [Actinomycetota bacterium]